MFSQSLLNNSKFRSTYFLLLILFSSLFLSLVTKLILLNKTFEDNNCRRMNGRNKIRLTGPFCLMIRCLIWSKIRNFKFKWIIFVNNRLNWRWMLNDSETYYWSTKIILSFSTIEFLIKTINKNTVYAGKLWTKAFYTEFHLENRQIHLAIAKLKRYLEDILYRFRFQRFLNRKKKVWHIQTNCYVLRTVINTFIYFQSGSERKFPTLVNDSYGSSDYCCSVYHCNGFNVINSKAWLIDNTVVSSDSILFVSPLIMFS